MDRDLRTSIVLALIVALFGMASGSSRPVGLYRWAIYPVPFHKPHHPHAIQRA